MSCYRIEIIVRGVETGVLKGDLVAKQEKLQVNNLPRAASGTCGSLHAGGDSMPVRCGSNIIRRN